MIELAIQALEQAGHGGGLATCKCLGEMKIERAKKRGLEVSEGPAVKVHDQATARTVQLGESRLFIVQCDEPAPEAFVCTARQHVRCAFFEYARAEA